MNRPTLHEIPLDLAVILAAPGLSCTMSVGQWDQTLAAFYDLGAALIELDDDEVPIAAYQKNELKI